MARLTKYQRQAFVEAIMQDVPTINYEEQAHKIVKDAALAILPPQIRAIADNKDLNHYLETTNHWFGYHHGGWSSVSVFQGRCTDYMTADVQKRLADLVLMSEAQNERLNDMRAKLKGAIEGCTTDTMARELLPEFVKYLPEKEEKTSYLPAIANLVADLTKLGWPEDKAAATV